MFTLTIESNATVKVNRRPVSAQPLLRTLSSSVCQSAFLSILALSSQVHAQSASKPQFVWKQNSAYQAIDKVRFANGEVAIVKQDPRQSRGNNPDLFGNRLYVGKEGELRPQTDPGRLVAIEAAYPSASNAKVAIASTNCGGTMCGRYSDYFVVFIGEHGLRAAAIGTGFYAPKGKSTTYEFWFDGHRIARSVIRNFFDGSENDLGDLVPSTRIFAHSGFFLDSRFKQLYEQFVGEHPESVLADEKARAAIVRTIDPASFRAYRSAMSGPGSSTVTNGRFVVMNACMAHFCTSEFGTVVLDGFTGDIRLLRFDARTKAFSTASTRPFDESRDWRWIDAVETYDVVQLSATSAELKADWK